jgi:hypothetical protein
MISTRLPHGEVQEWAFRRSHAGSRETSARRLLVIYHQAEMTAIVCGLPATLLKSDELVAEIDKGHSRTFSAQLEREEAAVERQSLFAIPYLQRDVIEPYDARLCRLNHLSCPSSSSITKPSSLSD